MKVKKGRQREQASWQGAATGTATSYAALHCNLWPPVRSRLVVKKHGQATEVRVGKHTVSLMVSDPVVTLDIGVMAAKSMQPVFVMAFFVAVFVIGATAVPVAVIIAMIETAEVAVVISLVTGIAAILLVMSTPAMVVVSSVCGQW